MFAHFLRINFVCNKPMYNVLKLKKKKFAIYSQNVIVRGRPR